MESEIFINPELDGNSFTYPGNRVGILLIHGFRATTAEVRLLADQLSGKGYTIHAPLLSGHGTTLQDLNNTTFRAWLEDAETGYLFLKQNCDRVFVAGESMGGLLALHLAAKYPDIRSTVCYSPAILVDKLWLTPILKYVIKELPNSQSKDSLPWKGYRSIPTKASAELYALQRYVRSILKQVKQPICVFIGGEDRRIAKESGNFILDRVSSNDREIYFFDKSPHCMILSEDLPMISQRTAQFIEKYNTD